MIISILNKLQSKKIAHSHTIKNVCILTTYSTKKYASEILLVLTYRQHFTKATVLSFYFVYVFLPYSVYYAYKVPTQLPVVHKYLIPCQIKDESISITINFGRKGLNLHTPSHHLLILGYW